ncbi:MAG: hypothetical protein M1835_006578 [Candelina submexicana]|nr:MAG: hypothetical protein M1835_006578 [Candelina submexicana]
MWIFCSLELSTYSLSDVSPSQSSDRQQEIKECTRHLLSLLEKLRTLDVPPTTDSSIDSSTVLVGSLRERTLRLLQDHANGKVIKTNHGPYAKYIFSTQTHPPPSQPPLPSNLVFAPLRPEHFPLVLSRTPIPRKARTLLLCPSMGIFPTSPNSDPDSTTSPPPIAWAFLSPDGSLASLHCEETHRGRGLARAVTCKLFETGISSFASDGLAHADVEMQNLASQGLCRSVGAEESWEVYWTRIDLGAIP